MNSWLFSFQPNHFSILLFLGSLCCPDAKDNSFTRSRSSSVTSIDRESREAISSFHFCESYPRKTDSLLSPCVLVGTTQGFVIMVALSLPPAGDQRLQQPVSISSCGRKLNLISFTRCDPESCINPSTTLNDVSWLAFKTEDAVLGLNSYTSF